jgi:replicative DNA helicase
MLAGSVPNLSNVRQYARIIRDNSILRNLLAATQDIQTRVYQRDTSTRDLIDRAETAILRVSDQGRKQPFRPVGDILHESLEALEQLTLGETTLTGLTSGFADLDLITGGFQPGNLIILAARPSMGKSALMANFAENAALNQDRAVALFSLEMSQQELSQRFVASQAGIKGDAIRRGQIKPGDWPHILEASNRLANSPLYIDDSSDLSVLDIRSHCRRLAQSHPTGLGLVLVDYLQLMRPSDQSDNRNDQVSQISRGLKGLARELSVPSSRCPS